MWKQIISAFRMLLVMTFLTGLVYPLTMTGLAQTLMPFRANGSIVLKDGQPVGSRLIGQNFTSADYFHGRPSAAGQDGYDAAGSGGSNLGPTNKQLVDKVRKRVSKIRSENGLSFDYGVPADLVTASGSGLDPDISPAAAYLQAERVAKARSLAVDVVHKLIDSQVKPRQGGLLGEPRVNVLELNLALDALKF
jgi:K+-transporting ATPase ATPase C chain